MKSQTTSLNILGFVLSGILLGSSQFAEIEKIIEYKKGSSLSSCFEPKKEAKEHKKASIFSLNVDMPITKKSDEKLSQLRINAKEQPFSLPKIEIAVKKNTGKKNEIAIQPSTRQPSSVFLTQRAEVQQISKKPLRVTVKTNGCPKNLDYYTKRPRPIQMPTECLTCQNLINCVSSADNQ